MGTYHLMGLGRSPGAITGPISYLAYRYRRWNADDQRFFACSGEARRRGAWTFLGLTQLMELV